jgi:fibronectin type 3 domain-containing protein
MKVEITRLRRAAVAAIVCVSTLLSPNAFALTPFPASAGLFALTWQVPESNEDGSPLTDLAGYYIYLGDSPDTMVPYYFTSADTPTITVTYTGANYRYYGVAAISADGVEGDMTVIALGPLNGGQ